MREALALEGATLASLLEPAQEKSGRPVQIALSAIEFDAAQPRRHIDAAALADLARTIGQCGVIQPVSVHPKPGAAGVYVVNVGERRVRAARMAGLATVPAFIEAPLGAWARVTENLAREDLSPFDLATFIVEREAAGESRAAIARGLGKPASFVTELAELARAPAMVRRIHADGRCGDVRVLYRLARLAAVNPQGVETLAEERAPVTRARLDAIEGRSSTTGAGGRARSGPGVRERRRRPDALLVRIGERLGFMRLDAGPSATEVRVVFSDGSRETVSLASLRLIQWTELR